MSQTVALHIPKELYEALRTEAAKKGRTPDALVVEWLAEAIRAANRIEADPLVKLFGTLESDVTNIADRHDDYIGLSVARELRDNE
jgi:hypothetical protein